ncbi:MAG TPA: hypothetical protein VJ385_14800 [Fibrobacteria bacterium]|nr:hypothetical protein [Fibrobacteria bacterium]
MPTRPADPRSRIAGIPVLLCAAFLCQGFYCSQKHDVPSLPSARLTDIHLKMENPALGSPGVYLAWSYPEDGRVTLFEIYQATHKDSLKHAILTRPAGDSFHVVLPLPDSTRPFTLYYAVRAVWVEPTGQKLIGDTLRIDSLTINPSLTILKPTAGSHVSGRTLSMEVQTAGDDGVIIRLSYFEKSGDAWPLKQDTCLPINGCEQPIFGNSVQRDSLTLEQHGVGDTVQALFCVVGTESFQEQSTGLVQSLSCSRFFRVNP